MDKTITAQGVFFRFIKLTSAAFIVMVAITSFLTVAMWCAAFFAFWGNPPAFPWFIWRMFIGLSVFLSAAFGLIAAIIDTKD